MAERGRIYRWPRHRGLADLKARPVIVISPDLATAALHRWVVVPLSSDARLAANPLAVLLPPDPSNGLEVASYAMAWIPTAVERAQLSGPLGRVAANQLREVLKAVARALDLSMQEPWNEN